MAIIETTNAVTHPTPNIAISIPVIPAPSPKNFNSFRALAPNITGIARKNVKIQQQPSGSTSQVPSKGAPEMSKIIA